MTIALPTTLNAGATKIEEIEFLNEIASGVQHGTYLSTLFTEEFVAWATKSIREDGWLDIMADMQAIRGNAAENDRRCTESAQFAQAEINRLNENIKSLQSIAEYVQAKRECDVDCYEGQIEDLRTDCNDAYTRLQNTEYELEQARKQIAALKIELFNREHPELA